MSDAEATMRASLREAVVYALMLGLGEAFFVADAVRMGASAIELGLVVALPLFVGALGPAGALAAIGRGLSMRKLAVFGAVVQALALTMLAAAELFARLTPSSLIGLACIYHVAGQLTGTAWSAWIGDVVPATERGGYFARRTRRVHGGTVAGLVGAGATLQLTGARGDGLGFAVIFGAAAAMRLASAGSFASCPEPEPRSILPLRAFRAELRAADGRRILGLVLAVFSLQLSVYLAAPYFAPFMLETLDMSYLAFTAATFAVGLGSALALPAWGRAIDRYGARPTFLLAVLLIAVVPAPWFFATGLGVVAPAQAFSGIGWAGYEVGLFSLLLEITRPAARPYAVALVAVATGTGQLLGGLLGALVVGRFAFVGVLAATLAARLAISLGLPALVSATDTKTIGRRKLLLRVIGIRPNAGLIHRLLLVEPGDDDEVPARDVDPSSTR